MNRIVVRAFPGVLVAASLLAWVTTPLAAQNIESDSVPRFDLDSVTVNIMRTPIRVGDSPYTISVAGAAELKEGKSGMFLEDALETLPGVQVQNRFNYAVGERVSIRGFGSRAQFGVRGIHVEVDGIPATLPDGQSTLDHVDIGALGRVEALRGPASALYGNSSGGVLRFETEIPSRSPFRQQATAVAGSDGLLRLQSISGGTVGTTGYLLSVDRLDYDGYRRDVAADEPYGSAKRLHVVGRLEQPMAGGSLGITINHMDLDAQNPGSLRLNLLEADPTQVFAPSYLNFQTRKEVQQSQVGVTWGGPIGALDLDAVAYGLNRDFFNPLPGDIADVDRRSGGARVTVGGRTTSGNVGIDIRGGVQGDYQNDDRREFVNVGGEPGDLQLNQTERVRSLGSFVQTSLTVAERVTLMGALRYDHTHFDVTDLFPVSATNADDSGARDMNKLSPSVGIHVSATPEIGFFANFATSFETPTTVELGNREGGAGGFNPDLDPMTGKTVEAGLRGTFADRISLEGSVFHTTLKNELIAYEVASAPGLTYYRNAGQSTRNGAELVARVRAHDLVTLQGSLNYIDAKFDEYVDDNGNDYSGNKVPGLAPKQFQGSVRFGPSAWYLEVASEYTASMEVNDANVDNVTPGAPLTNTSARPTDAYWIFEVRAGANQYQLGRLQVSPFAGLQNLFDKTYVSSVAINAFGSRFYEPGPGRTFFVGATISVAR
jgi:iron complex outermembrane receptor protein